MPFVSHPFLRGSVIEPRFLKLFYRRVSGLRNGDVNRLDMSGFYGSMDEMGVQWVYPLVNVYMGMGQN